MQLTYSAVLASGIQRSDAVTYTDTCSFSKSFHLGYSKILSIVPCVLPLALLVICFISSSVYVLIPTQFTPSFPPTHTRPSFSSGNHVCFLCL